MFFADNTSRKREKAQPLAPKLPLQLFWIAASAVLLLLIPACGQDSPAVRASRPHHSQQQTSNSDFGVSAEDLEKYKPLMEEVGRLMTRIEHEIKVPEPRTQSRLLPLVPMGSSFFVSLPNYGDMVQQVHEIFLDQLKNSPALNDWWQNKAGAARPMVEEAIQKIHQFSEYLGNEIVIAGTFNGKDASVVLIAEARKPGLKAFIDQMVAQYGGKSNHPLKVLTPQQLLTAKASGKDQLTMLVRPDFVVAASDLPTLKSFNATLNRGGGKFNTSSLGQRLLQSYASGAVFLGGLDLQQLLALRPEHNPMADKALQQSGFGDLKNLIVESKYISGVASTRGEISFNGPRHGIAAWLAAPAPLPGLDFVSADSAYTVAVMLKPPSQMFDDIKTIAESVNPMAGAGIEQAETSLKIRLKEDLLNKLGGQITVAVEGALFPDLKWKVMLPVSDPDGLQQTLARLVDLANENSGAGKALRLEQEPEGGKRYYSLHISAGPSPLEVDYAFADGFMIVAGKKDVVKDAIALHESGNSLQRSSQFQSLLPQEHSNQASALVYENIPLVLRSVMRQISPEMADFFQTEKSKTQGVVTVLYGEDSAIRSVSTTHGFDPSMPLMIAAIAIPNLMRSKIAANESAAASAVRTVITAEVSYSSTYADKGYAPNLSALGPGSQDSCGMGPSPSHACLIGRKLGCDSQTWCLNNGYQFNVTGTCKGENCSDFVIIGTPVNPNAGGKSFCATSDGVVHYKVGSPLSAPVSAEECQNWRPL